MIFLHVSVCNLVAEYNIPCCGQFFQRLLFCFLDSTTSVVSHDDRLNGYATAVLVQHRVHVSEKHIMVAEFGLQNESVVEVGFEAEY